VIALGIPLVAGAALMGVVMLLAWFGQRMTGKAGIVDVVWTFGVGAEALLALVLIADGLVARRWLVGALVATWSLRLGTHLLARLIGKPEDERYARLKAAWGQRAQLRLLLFYEAQALAAPAFALPMLLAGNSQAPLGAWDVAGAIVGFGALLGERQADSQLARFRDNPVHRGQVCDEGWWRYSRHPNYFFEWLHWCSYPLFAVHAPLGWLASFAPLAMLYFLCFVTGVPPAEEQSLNSRGDAYRKYQARTSAFFPWWPRKCSQFDAAKSRSSWS
jgi:steroid 5-alpha reductase family enzyme